MNGNESFNFKNFYYISMYMIVMTIAAHWE